MARKIKFPLKMADETVRTLEELHKHFNLAAVLTYYDNGRLHEWLSSRGYGDIAKKIENLDQNSANFKKELCEALCVPYSDNMAVNVSLAAISKSNERRECLKKFTVDDIILAATDKVAFTQDELKGLLDKGVNEIYLCGEQFNIPVTVKGVTYIGVNRPMVVIDVNSISAVKDTGISFHDVEYCESYVQLLEEEEKRKNKASVLYSKSYVCVHNDWVYYMSNVNGNGVYKSLVNGKTIHKLAVEIDDDIIWWNTLFVDDTNIYRHKCNAICKDGWAYRSLEIDTGHTALCKSRADGSNSVKLAEDNCTELYEIKLILDSGFYIVGECLYFISKKTLSSEVFEAVLETADDELSDLIDEWGSGWRLNFNRVNINGGPITCIYEWNYDSLRYDDVFWCTDGNRLYFGKAGEFVKRVPVESGSSDKPQELDVMLPEDKHDIYEMRVHNGYLFIGTGRTNDFYFSDVFSSVDDYKDWQAYDIEKGKMHDNIFSGHAIEFADTYVFVYDSYENDEDDEDDYDELYIAKYTLDGQLLGDSIDGWEA